MTREKLDRAIEISEKIKEMEAFQKVFSDPGINGIIAYGPGSIKPVTLGVENGSELHKIIDDYLIRQLSELKNKFDGI